MTVGFVELTDANASPKLQHLIDSLLQRSLVPTRITTSTSFPDPACPAFQAFWNWLLPAARQGPAEAPWSCPRALRLALAAAASTRYLSIWLELLTPDLALAHPDIEPVFQSFLQEEMEHRDMLVQLTPFLDGQPFRSIDETPAALAVAAIEDSIYLLTLTSLLRLNSDGSVHSRLDLSCKVAPTGNSLALLGQFLYVLGKDDPSQVWVHKLDLELVGVLTLSAPQPWAGGPTPTYSLLSDGQRLLRVTHEVVAESFPLPSGLTPLTAVKRVTQSLLYEGTSKVHLVAALGQVALLRHANRGYDNHGFVNCCYQEDKNRFYVLTNDSILVFLSPWPARQRVPPGPPTPRGQLLGFLHDLSLQYFGYPMRTPVRGDRVVRAELFVDPRAVPLLVSLVRDALDQDDRWALTALLDILLAALLIFNNRRMEWDDMAPFAELQQLLSGVSDLPSPLVPLLRVGVGRVFYITAASRAEVLSTLPNPSPFHTNVLNALSYLPDFVTLFETTDGLNLQPVYAALQLPLLTTFVSNFLLALLHLIRTLDNPDLYVTCFAELSSFFLRQYGADAIDDEQRGPLLLLLLHLIELVATLQPSAAAQFRAVVQFSEKLLPVPAPVHTPAEPATLAGALQSAHPIGVSRIWYSVVLPPAPFYLLCFDLRTSLTEEEDFHLKVTRGDATTALDIRALRRNPLIFSGSTQSLTLSLNFGSPPPPESWGFKLNWFAVLPPSGALRSQVYTALYNTASEVLALAVSDQCLDLPASTLLNLEPFLQQGFVTAPNPHDLSQRLLNDPSHPLWSVLETGTESAGLRAAYRAMFVGVLWHTGLTALVEETAARELLVATYRHAVQHFRGWLQFRQQQLLAQDPTLNSSEQAYLALYPQVREKVALLLSFVSLASSAPSTPAKRRAEGESEAKRVKLDDDETYTLKRKSSVPIVEAIEVWHQRTHISSDVTQYYQTSRSVIAFLQADFAPVDVITSMTAAGSSADFRLDLFRLLAQALVHPSFLARQFLLQLGGFFADRKQHYIEKIYCGADRLKAIRYAFADMVSAIERALANNIHPLKDLLACFNFALDTSDVVVIGRSSLVRQLFALLGTELAVKDLTAVLLFLETVIVSAQRPPVPASLRRLLFTHLHTLAQTEFERAPSTNPARESVLFFALRCAHNCLISTQSSDLPQPTVTAFLDLVQQHSLRTSNPRIAQLMVKLSPPPLPLLPQLVLSTFSSPQVGEYRLWVLEGLRQVWQSAGQPLKPLLPILTGPRGNLPGALYLLGAWPSLRTGAAVQAKSPTGAIVKGRLNSFISERLTEWSLTCTDQVSLASLTDLSPAPVQPPPSLPLDLLLGLLGHVTPANDDIDVMILRVVEVSLPTLLLSEPERAQLETVLAPLLLARLQEPAQPLAPLPHIWSSYLLRPLPFDSTPLIGNSFDRGLPAITVTGEWPEQTLHFVSTTEPAAVQTVLPIPDSFYCEVEIIKSPLNGAAVGFTRYPSSRTASLPGWDYASTGYHGDDGFFRVNGKSKVGRVFAPGDVVGAGFERRDRMVFAYYTLNKTYCSMVRLPPGTYTLTIGAALAQSKVIVRAGLPRPTALTSDTLPLLLSFLGTPRSASSTVVIPMDPEPEIEPEPVPEPEEPEEEPEEGEEGEDAQDSDDGRFALPLNRLLRDDLSSHDILDSLDIVLAEPNAQHLFACRQPNLPLWHRLEPGTIVSYCGEEQAFKNRLGVVSGRDFTLIKVMFWSRQTNLHQELAVPQSDLVLLAADQPALRLTLDFRARPAPLLSLLSGHLAANIALLALKLDLSLPLFDSHSLYVFLDHVAPFRPDLLEDAPMTAKGGRAAFRRPAEIAPEQEALSALLRKHILPKFTQLAVQPRGLEDCEATEQPKAASAAQWAWLKGTRVLLAWDGDPILGGRPLRTQNSAPIVVVNAERVYFERASLQKETPLLAHYAPIAKGAFWLAHQVVLHGEQAQVERVFFDLRSPSEALARFYWQLVLIAHHRFPSLNWPPSVLGLLSQTLVGRGFFTLPSVNLLTQALYPLKTLRTKAAVLPDQFDILSHLLRCFSDQVPPPAYILNYINRADSERVIIESAHPYLTKAVSRRLDFPGAIGFSIEVHASHDCPPSFDFRLAGNPVPIRLVDTRHPASLYGYSPVRLYRGFSDLEAVPPQELNWLYCVECHQPCHNYGFHCVNCDYVVCMGHLDRVKTRTDVLCGRHIFFRCSSEVMDFQPCQPPLQLTTEPAVHNVACSACHVSPIVGLRLQCGHCDTNFCEACSAQVELHNPTHLFLYLPSPLIEEFKPPLQFEARSYWGYRFIVRPLYETAVDLTPSSLPSWPLQQTRSLIRLVARLAEERGISPEDFLPEDLASVPAALLDQYCPDHAEIALHLRLLHHLNKHLELLFPAIDLLNAFPGSLASTLIQGRDAIYPAVKNRIARAYFEATQLEVYDRDPFPVEFDRLSVESGRDTVPFLQAFHQLEGVSPAMLRAEQAYRASFRGEGANDAGGPFRESIAEMPLNLIHSSLRLFIPCSNAINDVGEGRECVVPNPEFLSSEEGRHHFHFLGRMLGIALRAGQLFPINLPLPLWGAIQGQPLQAQHLAAWDASSYASYRLLRNVEAEGITEASFTHVFDTNFTFASVTGQLVPLKPDGDNIPVTWQNRLEYAECLLQFKLHEFDFPLTLIREGLWDLVPMHIFSLFSVLEFEQLLCASPDISVPVLKLHCRYTGCSAADPVIQYFWQVLTDFTNEQRVQFLRFVWGATRLPTDYATSSPYKFHIQLVPCENPDSRLPLSHTCFFRLELPRYSSPDILRDKLTYAIAHCRAIDTDHHVHD